MTGKKKWADLSGTQKIGVVVLGTLQVSLLSAALWDIAHRTPEEVRGDRRMWAVLSFINWLGPLAYFTIGRKDGLCSRCMRCCCRRGEEGEPEQGEADTYSI